jgi:cytochrome c-type biogenesis protein CcmH
MHKICLALLLAWLASMAVAQPNGQTAPQTTAQNTVQPSARPMAADPALEEQVQRIAHELRCLVCQNETIAASNADLAVDLRQQIREQLKAGRSRAQILDFMAQRYGDFVLYTPPVKPLTWVLWGGPFVLLALMLVVLRTTLRGRQRSAQGPQLSAAELQRAQDLLSKEPR